MNERIKEFAEQAEQETRYEHNNAYWRMQDEMAEDVTWRKKFAELIVGECVLLIQLDILRNGATPENERSLQHVKKITQHFGIKNEQKSKPPPSPEVYRRTVLYVCQDHSAAMEKFFEISSTLPPHNSIKKSSTSGLYIECDDVRYEFYSITSSIDRLRGKLFDEVIVDECVRFVSTTDDRN